MWKVVFSVLGPTVEGQQQRPGRERTQEEKIAVLLNYLRGKKFLATERICGPTFYQRTEEEFRLETCAATQRCQQDSQTEHQRASAG